MPVLPVKVCKTTSYGVVDAESVLKIDGKATVLSSSGAEKPWIMLDMGEASLSGYAVVHVKNVIGSPAPVLRLSYANFDRKLTELGEYDDRMRAAYMTRDVELPVLPANIGRRQGTQKRRLELQGQVRVRASRQICRARHLCLIQPRKPRRLAGTVHAR